MILIRLGYWRSPIYDFLHDCPFKGLRSLPEFLDLTPRCQIDSPLPNWHAAERFDSPLQNAVGKFDSPLHHTAERFDSPLQNTAARFDSPLNNAVERLWCSWESNFHSNNSTNLKANSKKNLGYESGSKVGTFDEKKRRWKISRYCPFKCKKSAENTYSTEISAESKS